MEKSVPSFNMKEIPEDELYEKWIAWKRSLEHWLSARDIAEEKKLDNLMVLGGLELQKVYYALVPIKKKKTPSYAWAIKKLTAYFKPKHHMVFTRHKFWETRREPGESLESLIMKIRDKANACDFGTTEAESREYAMYDKLVMLMPKEIKEKLLQRNVTFTEAVQIIKAHESTKYQVQQLETTNKLTPLLTPHINFVQQNREQKFECFRCGSQNHSARSERCPAVNVECRKCGKKGHFGRVCKGEGKRQMSDRKDDGPDVKRQKYDAPDTKNQRFSRVNNVNKHDIHEIDHIDPSGVKVVCQVGDLNVRFLVDTGMIRIINEILDNVKEFYFVIQVPVRTSLTETLGESWLQEVTHLRMK